MITNYVYTTTNRIILHGVPEKKKTRRWFDIFVCLVCVRERDRKRKIIYILYSQIHTFAILII